MYTKRVKYVDYDGNNREEEFLFNITESEALELTMGRNGGLVKYLERLLARQDMRNLSKFYKSFILKAYGEKSDDGRRFIKSEELSTEFSQTEAYNVIYMELTTNPNSAAEFIEKVLPSKFMTDEAKGNIAAAKDKAIREANLQVLNSNA